MKHILRTDRISASGIMGLVPVDFEGFSEMIDYITGFITSRTKPESPLGARDSQLIAGLTSICAQTQVKNHQPV